MATVLHRTTLQLIGSAHTPGYPVEDWIHSPDLSAVAGVPARYWKITGDAVSEMSAAEKDTSYLAIVGKEKIDSVDARTEGLISAGFAYSSKQFSLSLSSQAKLMGTHQIKDDAALVYPINWNTIDDLDVHALADAAALDAFYLTALGTIRTHLDSGTVLKDSVRAATTVAAIDAITDTR